MFKKLTAGFFSKYFILAIDVNARIQNKTITLRQGV